jgi:hypothetical protein
MKYGSARIASVFKEMLTTAGHAGTPLRWPTTALGAGIANAQSLLDAPLPATVHAAGMALRAGGRTPVENDFDRIASYFPRAEPARVRAWLLGMFGREGTRARHQARRVRGRNRIPSRRRSQRLCRDACGARGAPRRGCASPGQAAAASFPQPEATTGVSGYLLSGV